MNNHRLCFVYGSLLKGEPNHRHLAASTLVRDARTRAAFTLLDLGPFPGLVTGGITAVLGEVYEIDDIALAGLDRLEGHPGFYRRQEIPLDDGARVLAYLLPAEQRTRYAAVGGGDWRAHRAARGTTPR